MSSFSFFGVRSMRSADLRKKKREHSSEIKTTKKKKEDKCCIECEDLVICHFSKELEGDESWSRSLLPLTL